MLWRGSRRWSTFQPSRQALLRFIVLPTSNSLNSSAFQSWRLHSSATASATQFHRRDAAIPPPRPPRRAKQDKGRPERDRQRAPKTSAGTLDGPEDLLVLIDNIFATPSSRDLVYRVPSQWTRWVAFLTDGEAVCRLADQLACTNAPHRAHQLLYVAHAAGARFKQSVYERVAFRLAEVKEWHIMLAVVTAGINSTGKTTPRLLNWRTRALVEVQHFARLDEILEDFEIYGLKPQRRTFHLILRGHLLNHNLARAKSTIQDMERAGFPADSSTYTVVASVYRGIGPDKFVRDRAYEILGSPDAPKKATVMNSLLRTYFDKHDLDGALRFLESVTNQARTLKPGHASIVVDGVKRAVSFAKPPDSAVARADCATFSMLINYMSRRQDLSWLNGIMQRMKSIGVTPDAGVAAALVRMYYAHSSEKQALVVLLDICRPFDLNVKLLNRLGYEEEDNLPSHGPFQGGPSVELFNSVMQGALQTRGFRSVPIVLRLMNSVKLEPNTTTLEIFLDHLDKMRHIRPRTVVRTLLSLLSYKIRPTMKHLNIILRSVVRTKRSYVRKEGWNALASHVRQVTETYESEPRHLQTQIAEKQPLLTDPHLDMTLRRSRTFRSLLDPIIQSLLARAVKADRATFALRMRYDLFTLPPPEAAASATRILQSMRDRGLQPNEYHYAAIMEAQCAAGNFRTARAIMKDARARGALTTSTSRVMLHTILITAYARRGRPDLALTVFQEMLHADVVPDAAAVDAVVGAFFAVKAFRLARRVLLDLWPMVAPFPEELREASLRELITHLRELRRETENGGRRVAATTQQRHVLRWQLCKIIRQWRAMSYGKEVLTPPRMSVLKASQLTSSRTKGSCLAASQHMDPP